MYHSVSGRTLRCRAYMPDANWKIGGEYTRDRDAAHPTDTSAAGANWGCFFASDGCTEASRMRADSRAMGSRSGHQRVPQPCRSAYMYADATHTLSHNSWGPLLHALACASAVHAAFPPLRRATGYEGEGIVSSHHCVAGLAQLRYHTPWYTERTRSSRVSVALLRIKRHGWCAAVRAASGEE